MKDNLPIAFRPMQPSDEPFIYSTWLKSYRNSSFAEAMSNDVFFASHKDIIAGLLETASVVMIVNPEDHDQIYGYSVTHNSLPITHFIYVKYTFRRLGLVAKLVEENGIFGHSVNFITHLPRNYQSWKTKYNLEYSPYLLKD